MSFYEMVWIARQDFSTAQVETLSEQLISMIEQQGGKIGKKEFWGLRTLAAPMRKNSKGHYVLYQMELPGEVVRTLSRNLQQNEDILRHLIVRIPALDPNPSIMMSQSRNQDDRRGPRGGGRGHAPHRPPAEGAGGDAPSRSGGAAGRGTPPAPA